VVGPQTTRNGVVAIDPHTTRCRVARDHNLAGTNNDIPRFGMMRACGSVRRSTEADQEAYRQERPHSIFSSPFSGGAWAAPSQPVTASGFESAGTRGRLGT